MHNGLNPIPSIYTQSICNAFAEPHENYSVPSRNKWVSEHTARMAAGIAAQAVTQAVARVACRTATAQWAYARIATSLVFKE